MDWSIENQIDVDEMVRILDHSAVLRFEDELG